MRALGLTILNSLHAARAVGIDTDGMLDGLSFDEAALASGLMWVPWTDTATLFNRLEPHLDDDRVDAMVSRHMQTHPAFRVLARFAVSPSEWLSLFWKWNVPMNPMARLDYDANGDPHVFRYALIGDVEASRLWLRLTHAAALHALAPCGLPPLEVVDVDIGDREMRARYRAPLDPMREERLAEAHAQPWSEIVGALEVLGPALGLTVRDGHFTFAPLLAAHVDEVADLVAAFALTPAEARVALSLAAGRTPAEVADHLQIAVGTVRTHLKRAYDKTKTSGQRELAERVIAHRRG